MAVDDLMTSREQLKTRARKILARLRAVIEKRRETERTLAANRRRVWLERVQRQRNFLNSLKP